MVTFNLWTDTRQISAAPNSHQYLILLVRFWKMTSFATNWIAFFGAKSRCFLPCLRSPTKATLCCRDIIIQRHRDAGYTMIEHFH